MKIIDSHVHFWDPQKIEYPWLANEPPLKRAYLPDHVPARVGAAEIEGIVFVEADVARGQGLDEVDFVSRLAAQDPRVRGIVAFAPIEDTNNLRPYLDALIQRPLVKGVRRLIQDEPTGFCLQPDFIAGVQALAAYDLPFDLCIRHPQLAETILLVRACPQIRFVLDHIGKPDIKNHLLEPWRTGISELAEQDNVSVKLSGLVTEADHTAWTADDLHPYIEHILAAFGTDRVMFGSDAPVAYLATTYDRWVEMLQNATRQLSETEQQKLWHANAQTFYRL